MLRNVPDLKNFVKPPIRLSFLNLALLSHLLLLSVRVDVRIAAAHLSFKTGKSDFHRTRLLATVG